MAKLPAQSDIVDCRRCPRLVEYREQVAEVKVRRFRDWEYWGRPVPSLGPASARLLVIGLAPAAHGGDRRGRVFAGDRWGGWFFRPAPKFRVAKQRTSIHPNEARQIHDCCTTPA